MSVRGLFFLAAMGCSGVSVNAMLGESVLGYSSSNNSIGYQGDPTQGLNDFLEEHVAIIMPDDVVGLIRKINDAKRKINAGNLLDLHNEYNAISTKLNAIKKKLTSAVISLDPHIKSLLFDLEKGSLLRDLMEKSYSFKSALTTDELQCFQLILRMFFLPNINAPLTRIQGLVVLACLLLIGSDRKVIEEKLKLLCIGNDEVFVELLAVMDEYDATLIKTISPFFSDRIITTINENDLNLAAYCLSDGKNLLHVAVQSNLVELVEFLIQGNDIDINEKTFLGVSPLKIAIDMGNRELVELLCTPEDINLFITTNQGKELSVNEYIDRKINEEDLSEKYVMVLRSIHEMFAIKEIEIIEGDYVDGDGILYPIRQDSTEENQSRGLLNLITFGYYG